MKSKIIIFFAILSVIYSCDVSNISNEEITRQDLIGNWTIESIIVDEATLSVTSPVNVTLTSSGFGKNFTTVISFTENPDEVSIVGDFIFELTYKELGGVEKTEELLFDTIFFSNNFGFTSSNWQLINNILRLNEGGEVLSIDVISFADNVLTIETDINRSISLNGVTSTVSGKSVIKLRKQ